MLEVLESYDNSSLLFSAFLWISALCVMKRNLRIKKKLHSKNRRSESKCKDCGRQQKDSRDRCSTEHRLWLPRGLEGLLLRLAKCLVLLIKYELLRLKGLSRKLTMSLYQNSATAPKPLSEPGV